MLLFVFFGLCVANTQLNFYEITSYLKAVPSNNELEENVLKLTLALDYFSGVYYIAMFISAVRTNLLYTQKFYSCFFDKDFLEANTDFEEVFFFTYYQRGAFTIDEKKHFKTKFDNDSKLLKQFENSYNYLSNKAQEQVAKVRIDYLQTLIQQICKNLTLTCFRDLFFHFKHESYFTEIHINYKRLFRIYLLFMILKEPNGINVPGEFQHDIQRLKYKVPKSVSSFEDAFEMYLSVIQITEFVNDVLGIKLRFPETKELWKHNIKNMELPVQVFGKMLLKIQIHVRTSLKKLDAFLLENLTSKLETYNSCWKMKYIRLFKKISKRQVSHVIFTFENGLLTYVSVKQDKLLSKYQKALIGHISLLRNTANFFTPCKPKTFFKKIKFWNY